MMAKAVDANRMYIWKNHAEDGCLYEWSEKAEPQQNSEHTAPVPYAENAPGQAYLSLRDVLSVLMVPLFIHDQFWGFARFDDCRRERMFMENEESILRSGSLLISHALLRNEMELGIRAAVERSPRGEPRKRHIPFVAMTANVFREDIEKCLEAGMNAHVGKPLDFNEVMEKIKCHLHINI